jgi:hypothetical protein
MKGKVRGALLNGGLEVTKRRYRVHKSKGKVIEKDELDKNR